MGLTEKKTTECTLFQAAALQAATGYQPRIHEHGDVPQVSAFRLI